MNARTFFFQLLMMSLCFALATCSSHEGAEGEFKAATRAEGPESANGSNDGVSRDSNTSSDLNTASQTIVSSGPRAEAEIALDMQISSIAGNFDGLVGVAVYDIGRKRLVDFQGARLFPQQSLSKLWVTLSALQKVDAGDLDLSERVSVRRDDLTVFHQPLRKIVLARGVFHTDYRDLMRRAITESDNTANDLLLRRIGGPAGVRNGLAQAQLEKIRFGPGETAMQSGIAGLKWDRSYALGKRFFDARKNVPKSERRRAFDSYVADPVDGASPRAIAVALGALSEGKLLNDASTAHFLGLLRAVKSGPNRLKGGLPQGWMIGHKTGTGQVLDIVPPGVMGEQAGYNDVAILTAPDGSQYSVAVMIGRTRVPVPERMDMMHKIMGAIAAYHEGVKAGADGDIDRREGRAE